MYIYIYIYISPTLPSDARLTVATGALLENNLHRMSMGEHPRC